MNRAHLTGFAFLLIGAFFLTRSLRPATHSTVGIIAGCLLLAAGVLRIARGRRTPLP